MRYLVIAGFGALGAVARYAVDGVVSRATAGQFPWGTLAVNVAGSFALGLLVELTTSRMVLPAEWRVALGIGFLGAFTTFSTFAYETVRMLEAGAVGEALANVALSLALGIAAAALGVGVGRVI